MKFATLKEGGRDGTLVVVSRDLASAAKAPVPTLQAALDDWDAAAPELQKLSDKISSGGESVFPLRAEDLAAPLPRAFQWIDGSVYLNHAELVRKSRGAEVPPSAYEEPMMYQGGSDSMLGPRDPIVMADEAYGIDFEAELIVITGDVPAQADEKACAAAIRLVTIANDVSLRNLIPGELGKGFGFLQSKPSTGFAPVVATPDELGSAWRDYTVHHPLVSTLNGAEVGHPNCGVDMNFSMVRLMQYATKTRMLSAGTIVGSGTVSNRDRSTGSSCIAEIRAIETIEHGEPKTDYMKFGDIIRIEMLDDSGASVFGAIEQTVRKL